MSLKDAIINNASYNLWVSEQLVAWLQGNPEELLHQECPSSFNSMARTLKHISDTQRYWSSMIRGSETPQFAYMPTDVDIQSEIQHLVGEARILADYVNENVGAMEELRLIESPWFSSNFPKYEYLHHLVVHTTYHRGQLVTQGHQVGASKAPMLDYNFWNVMRHKAR